MENIKSRKSRWSPNVSISLQFPELGELEHHVIRIHERDDEPLLAVAEAAFEDVIPREYDRRVKQQLEPRGALALLEHLPRRECGVSIHADQMLGQVFIWIVLELA